MNYTHITREERYQIYALKKTGHKQYEIAEVLKRSESTISRELSRNCGRRGYRPKQAHSKSVERQSINARTIDDATWQFAQDRLLEQWNPEQISGHAAIVETRSRIGDWEADTVIGKNHRQAIVSIVERKTGFTLIQKVERKTALAVSQAMIGLLKPHRKKVHTITSDNGKEFAGHEEIASKLKANFYFAHPYSSWERGTNENTNGLIRQYFPKTRDFTTITQQEINMAMERLNNRPRKRLGYQTLLTPTEN